MQALSCHCTLSADIASWAPRHDKSVKLFSRASVPPAIVSKDDRERNVVLPPPRMDGLDGGRPILMFGTHALRSIFHSTAWRQWGRRSTTLR